MQRRFYAMHTNPDPACWTLVLLLPTLLFSGCVGSSIPGLENKNASQFRFMCIPIPTDTDAACLPLGGSTEAVGRGGAGTLDHAKAFLHFRESLVQQKQTILEQRETILEQRETILEQRETIRELTAKLSLCQGLGYSLMSHHSLPHPSTADSDRRGYAPHSSHHGYLPNTSHHGSHNLEHGHSHHRGTAARGKKQVSRETTSSPLSTPEQMGRVLMDLKERLENLQTRNTSTTYTSSLKDLLQYKIAALEEQMLHQTTSLTSSLQTNDGYQDSHNNSHQDNNSHGDQDNNSHYDNRREHDNGQQDNNDNYNDSHHGDSQDHHTTTMDKLHTVLNHLSQWSSNRAGSRTKSKASRTFQVRFPARTSYMYGRIRRTLLYEAFALTLCLRIKGGVGPGLGTPISYSVPGQANELVLMEWDNNPVELLISNKAVSLPLSLNDGKWHHVCVLWTARDGWWEVFQDGVRRGSGENLHSWRSIRPGGVFILGQEQDTLGGRFDAAQAFVGDISDLQLWTQVLTPHDIYSLATCTGHMTGDVIAWSESAVELHGGVTTYSFHPCH